MAEGSLISYAMTMELDRTHTSTSLYV